MADTNQSNQSMPDRALWQVGQLPTPPDPFNMAAYVLSGGQDCPEKVALRIVGPTGAQTMTYAQLRLAVLGTARGLIETGARPGDRVLLRLGNEARFPIAFLGAIAAGLLPVPTSAALTVGEITRLAAKVAPRLVLTSPGIALPQGLNGAHFLSAPDLDAMRALSPLAPVLGSPDRPAYIIFTSGTGGQTRAVTHAHRAIWARRSMWAGWYGLKPTDRLMHAGAFNWTYTLGTGLMDPWSVGATALIPEDGTQAADLPDLMRAHGATLFAAAPGIYRQMLHTRPGPLPDLRHGLSAGEKLAEPIRTKWREATGTNIIEAYGLSECSTFLSGAPDRDDPPGTVGRAQDGRKIAILGSNGPLAHGAEGMIAIHRSDPGLMLGYWEEDEATAARFQGDWFLTGDRGKMDQGGHVTYLGRADDMLNAGGFRVSPIEVEEAMLTHPAIQECAAIDCAVADDITLIALYYVAADDVPEEELRAHATRLLARYKEPRLYRRIDHLPRGANNKILRRTLRDERPTHDKA